MNIHPLFVHFPIAMLIVYAICELIRFRAVLAKPYWFYFKAFLVIIGSVSAFVTVKTGQMAEDVIREATGRVSDLIETHSTFALISTWLFTVLALLYIIAWIHKEKPHFFASFQFLAVRWLLVCRIARIVFSPAVLVILAVLGLCAISITGALGGAIVYGPDFDPFSKFVYGLFVE